MTVAFVQNRTYDNSPVTTASRAFLSNVTAGNLLLVYCWQGNDSTDDTNTWTVTDTIGNTYTRFAHSSETQFNANAATGSKQALFACISIGSGANTVNVGFGASKKFARMVIWEYSGTASPVASAVPSSAADSSAHFALPLAYFYQTATTATDPGSQNLKLNNATLSAVTAAYFDSLSVSSQNRDSFFSGLPTSGIGLRFFSDSDLTNYVDYTVTSVTNNTGWWTVGLSFVGTHGTIPQTGGSAWWAIFNWADDTVMPSVTAVAGGRVGTACQDLNGSSGSTLSGGFLNYFYQTSTAASDPGSGNVRLNNSTLTSATAAYFDSLDAGSVNQDTFFTSTLAVGDTVRFQTDADHQQWITFEVTSKTNNTGWWTIGLSALVMTGGENPNQAASAAWNAVFTRKASNGYAAGTGFENFRQTTPDGFLGTADKATAAGGSVAPTISNKNFSPASTSQLSAGEHFGISWALAPASTVALPPLAFLAGAGW